MFNNLNNRDLNISAIEVYDADGADEEEILPEVALLNKQSETDNLEIKVNTSPKLEICECSNPSLS